MCRDSRNLQMGARDWHEPRGMRVERLRASMKGAAAGPRQEGWLCLPPLEPRGDRPLVHAVSGLDAAADTFSPLAAP
jgi:hypothetical protein